MTSLIAASQAAVALATLNAINDNFAATNDRTATDRRNKRSTNNEDKWAVTTTTPSDCSKVETFGNALAVDRSASRSAHDDFDGVKADLNEIQKILSTAKDNGLDLGFFETKIQDILVDMEMKAEAATVDRQIDRSISPNTDRVVGPAGATVSVLTRSAPELTAVDTAIAAERKSITDTSKPAKEVGVNHSRVIDQSKFMSALTDANGHAAGAVVDAGLKANSTQLRALQTQQQTAVQSLSIANAPGQNILTLFK